MVPFHRVLFCFPPPLSPFQFSLGYFLSNTSLAVFFPSFYTLSFLYLRLFFYAKKKKYNMNSSSLVCLSLSVACFVSLSSFQRIFYYLVLSLGHKKGGGGLLSFSLSLFFPRHNTRKEYKMTYIYTPIYIYICVCVD